MTAGSIAVPLIIPLRAPIIGKSKNSIDTSTPIELKTGLFSLILMILSMISIRYLNLKRLQTLIFISRLMVQNQIHLFLQELKKVLLSIQSHLSYEKENEQSKQLVYQGFKIKTQMLITNDKREFLNIFLKPAFPTVFK